MMRHEVWTAILLASTDIERLVASSAGDLPDRRPVAPGPPRSTPPHLETAWRDLGRGPRSDAAAPPPLPAAERLDERDRERLAGLRGSVRARLETLWRALAGETGLDAIRRALVIYFDERIMRQLPEYLRLSWPLLQSELTGEATGGADFFRAVDDALADRGTPSLVLEVHHYCLSHGFTGMFARDLEQLAAYRRRLAERIALPAPRPPAALTDPGELSEPRPLWWYHSLGVGAVVALAAAMIALSNCDGMRWLE